MHAGHLGGETAWYIYPLLAHALFPLLIHIATLGVGLKVLLCFFTNYPQTRTHNLVPTRHLGGYTFSDTAAKTTAVTCTWVNSCIMGYSLAAFIRRLPNRVRKQYTVPLDVALLKPAAYIVLAITHMLL